MGSPASAPCPILHVMSCYPPLWPAVLCRTHIFEKDTWNPATIPDCPQHHPPLLVEIFFKIPDIPPSHPNWEKCTPLTLPLLHSFPSPCLNIKKKITGLQCSTLCHLHSPPLQSRAQCSPRSSSHPGVTPTGSESCVTQLRNPSVRTSL